MTAPLKIIIASSGLGRVQRGIETWSLDIAVELSRLGIQVALAGFEVPARRGVDYERINIRTPGRKSLCVKSIASLMPGVAWRFGLKSPYAIEQQVFWLKLRGFLSGYTFLHSQDPLLAHKSLGVSSKGGIKTILAHGTEESFEFLNQFDFVQHLAPWHYEQAVNWRRENGMGDVPPPGWTTIPNFVDCDRFRPDDGAGKATLCERFNLSKDTVVIGCAAAVKSTHKCMDYLISEMKELMRGSATKYFLYIAGSRTEESPVIEELISSLPEGSYHIDYDLSRDQMPAFYRSIDVFALCSLYEMMPIALLEALSSGLPVYVHAHPVLEWMVGSSESVIDMSRDGNLASAIKRESVAHMKDRGVAARKHAQMNFNKQIVVSQIIDYYHTVMGMNRD